MAKTTSKSRSERRKYEKFLKKVNPTAYDQWKSNSTERSKKFVEEQNQLIEDKQTEHLEGVQNKLINDLRNLGKTQEEIDRHIAIWIKTLKPWGSTEKSLTWKEAEKEYELESKSND
jgi:hypothetical protein